MRNRENTREITIDALHAWGTWKSTKGKAVGSGGSTDLDPRGAATRAPGVHSDPVYWEYVRTQQDGQGLNKFIDTRVVEQRQPVPRILIARYSFMYQFDKIAEALKLETSTLLAMHDNFVRSLSAAIKQYTEIARADQAARDYKWRVSRAIA